MRLLLVEDEPNAAEVLAQGLREQGYAVDIAADGEQGHFKAGLSPYDLIILDLMLPRKDGLTLCREMRAAGSAVPILMLTAKDTLEDAVTGLDSGADDYLTKPYEYRVLLARIRSLLRRGQTPYLDVIEVGDLRLELRTHRVTRAHREIKLTAKEYAVLEFLARRKDELVTREDLLEHAWDEHFDPLSNTIEVYMLRLRRKIDAGHAVQLLRTRRGEGYVLTAGGAGPHA